MQSAADDVQGGDGFTGLGNEVDAPGGDVYLPEAPLFPAQGALQPQYGRAALGQRLFQGRAQGRFGKGFPGGDGGALEQEGMVELAAGMGPVYGAGGLQGGLKLCAGYGRPQAVSTQSKHTGEARGGGGAAGPVARPAPFARYLLPRSASRAVTNGK